MKTNLTALIRATTIASALLALPVLASAATSTPEDRASQQLALAGSVAVKNAGPYVEVGTFQVQVSAKLGRPSNRLADGTWLYSNYEVENSTAQGTLVVRFNAQGRVSNLSLVTPAAAIALLTPAKTPEKVFVAGRD